MNRQDPDFQALKDITRLNWLLNFEALASLPVLEDAPLAPLAAE